MTPFGEVNRLIPDLDVYHRDPRRAHSQIAAFYPVALRSHSPSGRQILRFRAGKRSGTRCPSAAAGRCSGRAGSDRDAARRGIPPSPSLSGASSKLHNAPPSPARGEAAAATETP